MVLSRFRSIRWLVLLVSFGTQVNSALAQTDRGWVVDKENPAYQNRHVRTKSLTLYPAPEPRPALKYRLLPSEYDQVDGNAATYYLRAMGFVEQRHALREVMKLEDKAIQVSRDQGIPFHELPPHSWQSMSPNELPLEDVKKYLQLTGFQNRDIAFAHQMKFLDFSRNVRNVDSPYSVLLPEVQQLRGLARTQSIRCRVAIAENRVDDAFAIIGQQFGMGNHLSQEPFFVSNLVGIGIAGICWEDILDLLQMENAPNYYWAFAALPKPLVPIRATLSFETKLVFQEFKALKEVNEIPQSAKYWSTFIDRILPQYNSDLLTQYQQRRAMSRMELVNMIAAGHPGAKQYLIESEGMDAELVESYPIAQVFFLAQRKFCEYAMDETAKSGYVEFSQAISDPRIRSIEQQWVENSAMLGWAAFPADALGPATTQIQTAMMRIESLVALAQTIEGIRMYAAENNSHLPQKLSELPYPAPNDPFTGQPFPYEVNDQVAVLTADVRTMVYRLELQIAK
jgi:hypothetical protein